MAIVARCGLFEPEYRLETVDQWPSELLAADKSDKQLDQVAIEELKGRDVVDSQAQGVQALPHFCWSIFSIALQALAKQFEYAAHVLL